MATALVINELAAAFNWNLETYKFDKGMQRGQQYQQMDMKLAQFSLFREDVRDLFSLTYSNLSTYMTVGTLFFSLGITFIYCGYKDLPMQISWLPVFYSNCVFGSITLALLSVWLSMHGTIAAHSRSVTAMTQYVRLPVPGSGEVQAAAKTQQDFEEGALWRLAGPTNPLTAWAADKLGWTTFQPRRGLDSDVPRIPSTSSIGRQNTHGTNAAPNRRYPPPDTSKDQPATVDDGHIKLFTALQSEYANFDAYSRASLALAVNQMLLFLAYFCVAHILVSQKDLMPVRSRLLTWGCVVICTVGSAITMRLDLAVEAATLHLIRGVFIAAPLLACLSAHLWADRNNLPPGSVGYVRFSLIRVVPEVVEKMFAVLSALLHAVWVGLLLWTVRPAALEESKKLKPSGALRCVQFLDVFKKAEEEAKNAETQQSLGKDKEPPSTIPENQTSKGGIADAVGEHDGAGVSQVRAFEIADPQPLPFRDTFSNKPWKYFCNLAGSVILMWIITALYLFIGEIIFSVTEESYFSSQAPRSGKQIPVGWLDQLRPSAIACSEEALVLGGSFNIYIASLPKKLPEEGSQPSLELKPLNISGDVTDFVGWQSLDVLCSGSVCSSLFLLASSQKSVVQYMLKQENGYTIVTSSIEWNLSSQLVGADCIAIDIVQGNSADRICKDWLLHNAVEQDSRSTSNITQSWAMHATTTKGELISFCPVATSTRVPSHTLQPVHTLSADPVLSPASNYQGKGVHMDTMPHGGGVMWYTAVNSRGNTVVRAWGADGELQDEWQLHDDRLWAKGFCLRGKSLFAAAMKNTSSGIATPELWHFSF
jgi:hypothetical protein